MKKIFLFAFLLFVGFKSFAAFSDKLITKEIISTQCEIATVFISNGSELPYYFGFDFLCTGSSKTYFAVAKNNENVVLNQNLTYQWQKDGVDIPSETNISLTVTIAANYSVKVSQNSCTVTGNLTVNDFGFINSINYVYGDSYACEGTTKKLEATYTSNSVAYQWYKDGTIIANETNRSLTVINSGNYRVNVSDGTCIIYQDLEKSITFSKGLYSPIIATYGDTTLCPGSIVVLNAHQVNQHPDQYQYQWQKDGIDIPENVNSNAKKVSFAPNTPGNYRVIYKQGTCVSASKIQQVISSNKAQIPVITTKNLFSKENATEVCNGFIELKQINKIDYEIPFANGNYNTYGGMSGKWFKNGDEIPNSNANFYAANSAGTYTMKYGSGACEVESNAITLTFTGPMQPKIATINKKTTMCSFNDYIDLNYTNQSYYDVYSTYQWLKNNVEIPNSTNPYAFSDSPGTYKLRVTNGLCVAESNEIIITSGNDNLTIEPLFDINDCNNQLVKLNLIGNRPNSLSPGISWYRDGQIIPHEFSNQLLTNIPGTYTVTETGSGCNATSAPFFLNAKEVPKAPTIAPVTINNNESASIIATGCNGTVKWYDKASGGNLLFTGPTFVSPILSSSTLYYADCSNATCTSLTRQKVKITVNGGTNPITLGTITPIYYCTNGIITVPFTTTLPVGTVFTLQLFQNGQIIQSVNSETSPITLNLNPNIVLTNLVYSVNIITEDFASLQSYSLYVENFSSIRIHDGLLNGYSGDVLCPGKTKTLHSSFVGNPPNGPIIYKWYKDNVQIPNAIESTYTVSEGGTYNVRIGEGCSAISNSMPITISTEIYGGSIRNSLFDIACTNTEISLTAFYYSNSATYQWQKDGVDIPNATSRIYTANETGNYAIKAIDGTCESVVYGQKLTFTTGILAPIHSEFGDTTLCGGKSIKLLAISGQNQQNYSYQWIKDGVNIEGATNHDYTTSQPGKYQLAYIEGSCVSKSKEITLIESAKAQKPSISAGNIPDICSGTITISQQKDYNYILNNYPNLYGTWYKNEIVIPNTNNFSYHTTTESGTYHFMYGEGACAMESNKVTVTINEGNFVPKIKVYSYPPTTNICGSYDIFNNTVLRFDTDFINLNNVSYQWRLNGVNINDGAAGNIMFARLPGVYDLVVNNGSCSGISNSITITNNNTIQIYSQDNNAWCTNRAVNLTVDLNNYFYDNQIVWKRDGVIIPNEKGTSIYAITGGEYTATVNANGCNTTSPPFQFNASIPNYGFTVKSGNWNDPLCWICGQIPTATTDAKVSGGHIINVPAGVHEVKKVILEGSVNVETGGEIKLNN